MTEVLSFDVSKTSSLLPPKVLQLLSEDWEKCEPKLGHFLHILNKQGAQQCWHKHGTFKEHLFGVWRMLYLWGQDPSVCTLGLFHSSYSTSYVNLAIFKPSDRDFVKSLIGLEIEEMVHTISIIPRHNLLFDMLLKSDTIPEEGYKVQHIQTKEEINLSKEFLGKYLVMTMADYCDQWFDWYDNLFGNSDGLHLYDVKGFNPSPLWPGPSKPGMWMSLLSRMARILFNSKYEPLPPIFNNCKDILNEGDEIKAVDLYWQACCEAKTMSASELEETLSKCITLNPYFGEPRILLSQIHLQQKHFDEALFQAEYGLKLLLAMGTLADKRVSWEAMIAWSRILISKSKEKSWPDSPWGLVGLGLVK